MKKQNGINSFVSVSDRKKACRHDRGSGDQKDTTVSALNDHKTLDLLLTTTYK
jgi:hypothetical protein